jgi:hypothetical protein
MKYNIEQHGFGWRANLFTHLKESSINGDVYQFGVWDGFSLQVLGNMYKHILKTPNYFGFDVFTGMPLEENEPIQQKDDPGMFNLLKHYGVINLTDAIRMLQFDIETNLNGKLTLIPGLVQNTLNDDLIKKYNLKQASYVDFDMDIYSPTFYVFEFMIHHKLISTGTIIGFDDWNQQWEPTFTFGKFGESRAFKEICEMYNVKCKPLFKTENDGQTAFIVE